MIAGLSRRLLIALCVSSIAVASRAPVVPALALEGEFESATTRIEVKLDDRLSSQDNKVGDEFHFELTGSVMLDGVPVGAGTRGHGVVVDARSGRGPEHGFLTLAARALDLPDGRHVPVGLAPGSLDRKLSRESRGFSMPLGAAAPIYAGSSRDDNVVYEKGTHFDVISPPPETPDPTSD